MSGDGRNWYSDPEKINMPSRRHLYAEQTKYYAQDKIYVEDSRDSFGSFSTILYSVHGDHALLQGKFAPSIIW